MRSHRLARLALPTRAHSASRLPSVEIVDLRRTGAGPSGHPLLSITLHRAIESALAAREQIILFLNRRGFAPSVLCEGCGAIVRCPHCSVSLTLHRVGGAHLRCHYCDHEAPMPSACPECKCQRLQLVGLGTERLEDTLASAFPKARIARLDRDVAAGAKSEAVLAKMRRGEADILVGTQMVTKGHDLPDVTLVGVILADAALSMPDFRASERTFQLLVQVAGRAGRAERKGRVVVQTRLPEHPVLRFAAKQPGPGMKLHPVSMDFSYGASFGARPPTAYETLLLDAMAGDATLFARQDMVEAGWAVVQPILDVWAASKFDFPNYPAGRWGPAEADRMLARNGHRWRTP